jgi:hypothetical protein
VEKPSMALKEAAEKETDRAETWFLGSRIKEEQSLSPPEEIMCAPTALRDGLETKR